VYRQAPNRAIGASVPKMQRLRKIPQRLPQPGLSRGRVQLAVRRLFRLAAEITTADLRQVAYVRKRKCTSRDYKHMRRVLRAVADPIRRVPPSGAWLWRLRNSDE